FVFRVRFALLQYAGQIVQRTHEYGNGSLVHGNRHGCSGSGSGMDFSTVRVGRGEAKLRGVENTEECILHPSTSRLRCYAQDERILYRAGAPFPRGPRRIRAGSMNSARRNSNTPSTAKPSRRNGSAISHTSGHRISASNASGQQKISNSNHSRKVIIAASSDRMRAGSHGAKATGRQWDFRTAVAAFRP